MDDGRIDSGMFHSWLAEQKQHQENDYGFDFEKTRGNRAALADFLTWNFAATIEELGEMMHEVAWAPWKIGRGLVSSESRERALGEAVDVLHFLGNVLNALDITDEDLSEAYDKKLGINRDRLLSGRTLDMKSRVGAEEDETVRCHCSAGPGVCRCR